MDRKQYITLCLEVSTLPSGTAGTLPRVPPELLVTYDGGVYYPLGYEMKFRQGKHYDVAVLHDLRINSLVHAPLDKVTAREVI